MEDKGSNSQFCTEKQMNARKKKKKGIAKSNKKLQRIHMLKFQGYLVSIF